MNRPIGRRSAGAMAAWLAGAICIAGMGSPCPGDPPQPVPRSEDAAPTESESPQPSRQAETDQEAEYNPYRSLTFVRSLLAADEAVRRLPPEQVRQVENHYVEIDRLAGDGVAAGLIATRSELSGALRKLVTLYQAISESGTRKVVAEMMTTRGSEQERSEAEENASRSKLTERKGQQISAGLTAGTGGISVGAGARGETSTEKVKEEARTTRQQKIRNFREQLQNQAGVEQTVKVTDDQIRQLVDVRMDLLTCRAALEQWHERLVREATPYARLIADAETHFRAGEWRRAVVKLEDAWHLDARQNRYLVAAMRAWCHLRLDQPEKAYAVCRPLTHETARCPSELHALAGQAAWRMRNLQAARLCMEFPRAGKDVPDSREIQEKLNLPPQYWRIQLAVFMLADGRKPDLARQMVREAVAEAKNPRAVLDYIRPHVVLKSDRVIRHHVTLRIAGEVRKDWLKDNLYLRNEGHFPLHDVEAEFVAWNAAGEKKIFANSGKELKKLDKLANDGQRVYVGEKNMIQGDIVKITLYIECREGSIPEHVIWTRK